MDNPISNTTDEPGTTVDAITDNDSRRTNDGTDDDSTRPADSTPEASGEADNTQTDECTQCDECMQSDDGTQSDDSMQQLQDRLAALLERVHALEQEYARAIADARQPATATYADLTAGGPSNVAPPDFLAGRRHGFWED